MSYKIIFSKEYEIPDAGIRTYFGVEDIKEIGRSLIVEDMNAHVNQNFKSLKHDFFKVNIHKTTNLRSSKINKIPTIYPNINQIVLFLAADEFEKKYGEIDYEKNPTIFIEKPKLSSNNKKIRKIYLLPNLKEIFENLLDKYYSLFSNAVSFVEEEIKLQEISDINNIIGEYTHVPHPIWIDNDEGEDEEEDEN